MPGNLKRDVCLEMEEWGTWEQKPGVELRREVRKAHRRTGGNVTRSSGAGGGGRTPV